MTDLAPKLYLVCYDIADDRRRSRIFKLLRGYGEHIQFSIFRCILSPRRFAELHARIEPLVHRSEDQVLLVLLGKADSRKSWRATILGRPMPPPKRGAIIV